MGKKSGPSKTGSSKKTKGGGVQVQSKSSKSKGGGKGGGKDKTESVGGNRRDVRRAARDVRIMEGRGKKRKHGGPEAVAETRGRLKVKTLEKKLDKVAGEERAGVSRELGVLHMSMGRHQKAIANFQECLKLQAVDKDYARTQLLCCLMEQTQGEEARALVTGPLFLQISDDDHSTAARLARVTGIYTHVLLDYISLRVLKEDQDPGKVAKEERDLAARLLHAHALNPYVAEYLAFAPAFETLFPAGCDLPEEDQCKAEERPLLDALQYCCGLEQVNSWLGADDEVRRYLRAELFEASTEVDDAPPFAPLPDAPTAVLASRWTKARGEALELWAEEMSVYGDGMMEEEGEEESLACDDCSDASVACEGSEAKRFSGA